jgi:hypothetical protein
VPDPRLNGVNLRIRYKVPRQGITLLAPGVALSGTRGISINKKLCPGRGLRTNVYYNVKLRAPTAGAQIHFLKLTPGSA